MHLQVGMVNKADSQSKTGNDNSIMETEVEKNKQKQNDPALAGSNKSQAVMEWLLGK